MDNELEELTCVLLSSLRASDKVKESMKNALRNLWYCSYIECRDHVYDQIAIQNTIRTKVLPEHLQRIVNRYYVNERMPLSILIPYKLFNEIVCGDAVFECAADNVGHTWSKDVFMKSEVSAHSKDKILLPDSKRHIHA